MSCGSVCLGHLSILPLRINVQRPVLPICIKEEDTSVTATTTAKHANPYEFTSGNPEWTMVQIYICLHNVIGCTLGASLCAYVVKRFVPDCTGTGTDATRAFEEGHRTIQN